MVYLLRGPGLELGEKRELEMHQAIHESDRTYNINGGWGLEWDKMLHQGQALFVIDANTALCPIRWLRQLWMMTVRQLGALKGDKSGVYYQKWILPVTIWRTNHFQIHMMACWKFCGPNLDSVTRHLLSRVCPLLMRDTRRPRPPTCAEYLKAVSCRRPRSRFCSRMSMSASLFKHRPQAQ